MPILVGYESSIAFEQLAEDCQKGFGSSRDHSKCSLNFPGGLTDHLWLWRMTFRIAWYGIQIVWTVVVFPITLSITIPSPSTERSLPFWDTVAPFWSSVEGGIGELAAAPSASRRNSTAQDSPMCCVRNCDVAGATDFVQEVKPRLAMESKMIRSLEVMLYFVFLTNAHHCCDSRSVSATPASLWPDPRN